MKQLNLERTEHQSEFLYLSQVLESLPGSIYWKDQNGVYLGHNKFSAQKMCAEGLVDTIVGKTDYDLFPKEIADQYRVSDHWVMRTGEIYTCEESMPSLEGNMLIQLSIKQPLYDAQSNIVGVIGNTIDITERKQAEIAKTQFIENITHDIRTPLVGMLGVTQLMQATPKDSMARDYPMYANMLTESIEALFNFINHVLESVKLTAGERVVNLRRCSLLEILESIEKLQRPSMIQKDLNFIIEKDAIVSTEIIGDALRIKSILIELISNAIKYTKQGFVKCILRLEKTPQTWVLVLRVEDSGIGIPADKQNAIFDRFTRLKSAYEGGNTGSGLGLSNVTQLLQDLKADIQVESTVGVGSAFTCRIPVQLVES